VAKQEEAMTKVKTKRTAKTARKAKLKPQRKPANTVAPRSIPHSKSSVVLYPSDF
jgi:hypothetical protein